MILGPGEPAAGPWQVTPVDEFARSLTAGRPLDRPLIIAVDGRGGSGKTLLAARLCRALPPAAVVHSDDVAWNHSRFDWDDQMTAGILTPLHAGRPVHYQPPGWHPHGRTGHIDIPADATTVVIEGVGVSRTSLAPLIDVAIWVQSDYVEARTRGVARDIAEDGRSEADAYRNWDDWNAEEAPFLQKDRPWERAAFIIGTASVLPHDADTEVVVAPGDA
jgi:uridine kinase